MRLDVGVDEARCDAERLPHFGDRDRGRLVVLAGVVADLDLERPLLAEPGLLQQLARAVLALDRRQVAKIHRDTAHVVVDARRNQRLSRPPPAAPAPTATKRS